MIDLFFSDSACAGFKIAQRFGEGEYKKGPLLIGYADEDIPTAKELTAFVQEHVEDWHNAQIYDDEYHSDDEDRFILLGYSVISQLLIVCHCYRGEDESTIRIISARKATQHERQKYEERG